MGSVARRYGRVRAAVYDGRHLWEGVRWGPWHEGMGACVLRYTMPETSLPVGSRGTLRMGPTHAVGASLLTPPGGVPSRRPRSLAECIPPGGVPRGVLWWERHAVWGVDGGSLPRGLI